MDGRLFDSLIRELSSPGTRRRLLRVVAAIPIAGVLRTLVAADGAEGRRTKRGKGRRGDKDGKDGRITDGKRGQSRNKRRDKSTITICRPESKAKTCKGKCGKVKNNCKQRVNCGACPTCGGDAECTAFPNSYCDLAAGKCVCDADCTGKACGDDDGCGNRCLSGTCDSGQVCDAGECICTSDSCLSGCCATDICVAIESQSDERCGTGEPGAPCGPCGSDQECFEGACAPIHRPLAFSNSFTGDEGTECLQLNLIGLDDQGHTLSFVIVTAPENGELLDMDPPQVTATSQTLCYRPFQRFFHGTDAFTYQADDGIRRSNVATISITINDIN